MPFPSFKLKLLHLLLHLRTFLDKPQHLLVSSPFQYLPTRTAIVNFLCLYLSTISFRVYLEIHCVSFRKSILSVNIVAENLHKVCHGYKVTREYSALKPMCCVRFPTSAWQDCCADVPGTIGPVGRKLGT